MSETILQYYRDNHYPAYLLKKKIERFEQNPDIASEFEYWITNQEYADKDVVTVEGYTAERLSNISDNLRGEGSFMVMMDLREKPIETIEQIEKGYKLKD